LNLRSLDVCDNQGDWHSENFIAETKTIFTAVGMKDKRKSTLQDKQKHRNFISKFTQVITAHFFAMQKKRDKKITENNKQFT
jgi:hypothetical protein